MSNWAAYKEKEIGLPVFKRAKHGIHFKRNDGQIQAEFVGKPCHYFDGKEYKAIDTRPLLRKDGTFGCAHSDVIIHTDGTVQVGDYTQRAALIYPGKVSVDGDRIARPFSGGVQYLYITENGFRQEIVLEKMPDLTKVSALVDTVKGILPTKYTASALSLKDSSTAELSDFVQVDSKSLASVLEVAKFPVVIDPDFTSATDGGGDTGLASGSNSTRGYGTSAFFGSGTSIAAFLMRFDLSSISSAATPTDATLKLTKTYATSTGTATAYLHGIKQANGDWIESTVSHTTAKSGEPCWDAKIADGAGGVTTAWAGSAGCQTAGTDYETTAYGSFTWKREDEAGTQYTIQFNAAGITCTGTWYGSNTANYGLILPSTAGLSAYARIATSEYATESYRPILSVTYTAAGTFIPVNMMANTQNLTAGMRG